MGIFIFSTSLLDLLISRFTNFRKSAAAAAKSLQSCPTLCDPIDGSPPRSPFPGILQARTLEWVAISFSNGWKWKVKGKSLSHVRLLATPWTAAYQAPLSMGFSRQEYWSGGAIAFSIANVVDVKLHYTLVLNSTSVITNLLMKLYIYLYACVLNRFSCVWLSATPWIIVHDYSVCGILQEEHWNGLPCPPPDDLCSPPGNLPHPGIKPVPLTSPTLTGGFFTTRFTLEAHLSFCLLATHDSSSVQC